MSDYFWIIYFEIFFMDLKVVSGICNLKYILDYIVAISPSTLSILACTQSALENDKNTPHK